MVFNSNNSTNTEPFLCSFLRARKQDHLFWDVKRRYTAQVAHWCKSEILQMKTIENVFKLTMQGGVQVKKDYSLGVDIVPWAADTGLHAGVVFAKNFESLQVLCGGVYPWWHSLPSSHNVSYGCQIWRSSVTQWFVGLIISSSGGLWDCFFWAAEDYCLYFFHSQHCFLTENF